jgi:hypothetical protein
VGTDHDTSGFAVASLRAWWKVSWHIRKRNTFCSLLTVEVLTDGEEGNGNMLSNEIGIPIRVCYYLPETSKWNKIGYCLFPFISMNWKGVPLTDYQTIVELIRNTKTRTGLSV